MNIVEEYNRFITKKYITLLVLFCITLVIAIFSLMSGSRDISINDIVLALLGKGEGASFTIIRNIRLPRIAAAISVGCSLAMSGCIMQNVLSNPLASASTLGVSQGASFGAAVAIICLGAGTQINTGSASASSLSITNPFLVTVCAFIGGLSTTVVILLISRLRGATPSVMVLAGVAISSMFTGGTTLVQYFADDVMVASVVHWTFGNLGRAGYKETGIIAALCIIAFIYFFLHRWDYNSLESGSDTAKSLGVSVVTLIPLSLALCALIASVSVAFVGCINFIGLIAAHIMRIFVGNDFRFLIPATALCGAALLLLSDIAARVVIAPVVLPIGALTSFVGAPLFLYLIIRDKMI